MAAVKITPQLDTKPALKSFKQFSKSMGKPFISMGKDIDKTLKKFTYRNQIKEVRGLRAEFSKMNQGNEKSMKRQETLAKIQRTRQIQAAKYAPQYAAKAYQKSEINQSFHSGMGAAGAFMGNNSALIGGNFASTVSSQMQGVTNLKNAAMEKYKDWKQAKEDKKQRAREEGAFSSQNTGTGVSGGSGGTNRGGFLSSVGSGVMVIEGLAKAAGFLVNMASTVAEKRTGAINSQAGTLGATGGYVGGGGGLFANSEVARAQVEYNRSMMSEEGGKKGIGKQLGSISNFASLQGLGLGQATGAMGEIQRTSKDIRIEFIKGAAKASNIQGLKQGEFLTKFAEIVKGNRNEGFGKMDSKAFLSMAAGISQNKLVTPERGMDIASNLDKKARGGDKGGVFGQLALVDEMSRNGGDFFEALSTQERGGMNQKNMDFISSTLGDKNVMGYLAREEGVSTFTEGRTLQGMKGASIKEEGIGNAVGNAGLSRDNTDKSFFASAAIGKQADDLAAQMQKDNHEMISSMMGVLKETVTVVAKIETGIMSGMKGGMAKMESFAEDVQKEGGIVNAMKKGMKDAMKESFLPSFLK